MDTTFDRRRVLSAWRRDAKDVWVIIVTVDFDGEGEGGEGAGAVRWGRGLGGV